MTHPSDRNSFGAKKINWICFTINEFIWARTFVRSRGLTLAGRCCTSDFTIVCPSTILCLARFVMRPFRSVGVLRRIQLPARFPLLPLLDFWYFTGNWTVDAREMLPFTLQNRMKWLHEIHAPFDLHQIRGYSICCDKVIPNRRTRMIFTFFLNKILSWTPFLPRTRSPWSASSQLNAVWWMIPLKSANETLFREWNPSTDCTETTARLENSQKRTHFGIYEAMNVHAIREWHFHSRNKWSGSNGVR